MREVKAKVGKTGAGLKLNGVDWSVTTCMFVDDTMLLAESERELQRVVDKLIYHSLKFPLTLCQQHNVCSRRKLRVNAGKSEIVDLYTTTASDLTYLYTLQTKLTNLYGLQTK